ncbi:Transposase DDE domain-containing protein [Tangfeifania diversioriginum]|uniref:Transposase DDE domain-containing protein n=1 Tax=Tangfeifania diversioriginum TaxID=1168035 RepID=A0A1M6IXG0_9BACT|nr:transposase [Tangfeifania diversioriginum]SHJ39116.1 Transposase DDE domain-containing protein [Tangfeifania diversioriginum]
MLIKVSVFNKCRKDFICEVVILLLSIKGRVNFLQLGRFGNSKEHRYRQQFEKPFPWLDFNKELALSHGGSRFVIAFDLTDSYASDKGKLTRKLYFSTDTQMDALEILDCYQSRFQIEFLYRDAKQHTGLNDSQARSENKLNFHLNAALTTINIC